MDHFAAILSLIGGLFLAIIGVYVWTFKVYKDTKQSLGEIYKSINAHYQDADIHTVKSEFVSAEVYKVAHENLTDTIQEIKTDVKCLLTKMQ